MAKEKTLADFAAKSNKDLPFEDRAKKFEEAVKPLTVEYGINYLGVLKPTQTALNASVVLIDLWEKSSPAQ